MPKEILEYLNTQRIGVLAVEMPDGSPHAATIHFAHTDDPFVFIFETNSSYRKAEPLLKNSKTRASLVVGFSEEEMKTLQLDGEVALIDRSDSLVGTYLNKFPNKQGNENNPEAVFFTFSPNWWRFTDWRTPEGKKIFYSDGNVIIKNK